MGWDGLVIKLSVLLLKGSCVKVLKWGKETLYLKIFSLQKLRFHSVEILLFDVLAVQTFSSKCNVVMFRVQNGLVCCLEMKYEKS